MLLNAFRFLTLMLAGLGLTMGGAHVLELPPKMAYEPALYAEVTSTLYRVFGSVGAVIQISSVVVAAILTWLVRRQASFTLTLFGCLGLVLSLILWGALVAPVNAEWLEVMQTAPDSVPEAYARLRGRWEYGHAAAFAAWFAGYALLVLALVSDAARSQHVKRSTP